MKLIFSATPNFAFWFEAVEAVAFPHFSARHGHTEADQVGMFIDQVQIVKDAEEIALPSVVWLQRGDS